MAAKLDVTINIVDADAILRAALEEHYQGEEVGRITVRSRNRIVLTVDDGTLDTEGYRHHLRVDHSMLPSKKPHP